MGEYFSGVNIFQGWIFFRSEYLSEVNVFQCGLSQFTWSSSGNYPMKTIFVKNVGFDVSDDDEYDKEVSIEQARFISAEA